MPRLQVRRRVEALEDLADKLLQIELQLGDAPCTEDYGVEGSDAMQCTVNLTHDAALTQLAEAAGITLTAAVTFRPRLFVTKERARQPLPEPTNDELQQDVASLRLALEELTTALQGEGV